MKYTIQTRIIRYFSNSFGSFGSPYQQVNPGSSGKSSEEKNSSNEIPQIYYNSISPYDIPENSTVGQVKNLVKDSVLTGGNNIFTVKELILWTGNRELKDDSKICPKNALELYIIIE